MSGIVNISFNSEILKNTANAHQVATIQLKASLELLSIFITGMVAFNLAYENPEEASQIIATISYAIHIIKIYYKDGTLFRYIMNKSLFTDIYNFYKKTQQHGGNAETAVVVAPLRFDWTNKTHYNYLANDLLLMLNNVIHSKAITHLYPYFALYLLRPMQFNKDVTKLSVKANTLDTNHGSFASMSKSVITAYHNSQFTTEYTAPSNAMSYLHKLVGSSKNPFNALVETCSAIVSYDLPNEKNACVALLQVTGPNSVNIVAILTKHSCKDVELPVLHAIEDMCHKAGFNKIMLLALAKNNIDLFREAGYKCNKNRFNANFTCVKLLSNNTIITDTFIANHPALCGHSGPSHKSASSKKLSSRKTSSKRSSSRKISSSKKSAATRKSSSAKTI